MADNIPNVPAGAVPPKKETGKVQPKKETVRINLPPKPSAAPTIKLPTLPPAGPTSPTAHAAVAAPAAPPAPKIGTAAPVAQRPPMDRERATSATSSRPAPPPPPPKARGLSPVDTALAIAAAVVGLAAAGLTVWVSTL